MTAATDPLLRGYAMAGTFDGLRYIAGYPDRIRALAPTRKLARTTETASVRAKAAIHGRSIRFAMPWLMPI